MESLQWSIILIATVLTGVNGHDHTIMATCTMDPSTGIQGSPDERWIEGTVELEKVPDRGTKVTVNLWGFKDEDVGTLHGFHVHAGKETGNMCKAAGGHFNPGDVRHGDRDATERHTGDLGNVVVGADKRVRTTFIDRVISLDYGNTNDVVGRVIVLHAKPDDLGLVDNDGSRKTGNAGARLGCCQIIPGNGAGGSSTRAASLATVVLLAALYFAL